MSSDFAVSASQPKNQNSVIKVKSESDLQNT